MAGKLGEIVAGIGKVTDIVSEIAAAAKEQASGIEQVNQAVTEMDKVTQQNAASAEESSSAASELSAQSEELAAMVATFQIGRGATSAVLKRPATHGAVAGPARSMAPAKRHNGTAAKAILPARAMVEAFPMEDAAEVRDF